MPCLLPERPALALLEFGIRLHKWEYFVRSDDPAALQELREIFTGLELLPDGAAQSGLTVRMRGEVPSLEFTSGGSPCNPLEFLTGPEWRSLSAAPGQPRMLLDSILGLPYPVLEARGTELRVLQPEHWTRYVQAGMFHLMRVEQPVIGLHAALAAADDHTLVLVGGSGNGKSTLACALYQSGADCWGDDVTFVSVDDFRIHAPIRSITIRPGGFDLIQRPPNARWFAPNPADPKWLVELPLDQGPCHRRRATILLLDGFADAPSIRTLGGGETVRRLVQQMTCGDPSIMRRLEIAASLAERFTCRALKIGRPEETARFLIDYARSH